MLMVVVLFFSGFLSWLSEFLGGFKIARNFICLIYGSYKILGWEILYFE